jgi:hypothetical protein
MIEDMLKKARPAPKTSTQKEVVPKKGTVKNFRKTG